MNPIRNLSRSTARRLNRPLSRRLAHSGLRCVIPRRRGPDELAQALTAFRRAIRCRRRLAKLAPHFFDSVAVEHERLHRAERLAWQAQWLPALNKVYGLAPDAPPANPDEDLPPLPSLSVQAIVDQELVALTAWLDAGHAALEQYRQRRPHALPSFSQLARLLAIASAFGRSACGSDPDRPPPPPPNYDQVWADLERAYPTAVAVDHDAPAPAPPPVAASETIPPALPLRPAPAPLPPDDKRDLHPHRLIIGPHGLLCLQPIHS